jgi:hypothetical protein
LITQIEDAMESVQKEHGEEIIRTNFYFDEAYCQLVVFILSKTEVLVEISEQQFTNPMVISDAVSSRGG